MNFPVSAYHSAPRHKPLITEAANCLQPIQGSGLVMDLNGNGTIDSGRELFGDQTRVGDAYGNPQIPLLARNGFQALRKLDLNQDKLIDAQHAAFSQLKVWQDGNQDGTSQAPELKTLAELGITHIKLGGVVDTGQVQINGQRTQTAREQCCRKHAFTMESIALSAASKRAKCRSTSNTLAQNAYKIIGNCIPENKIHPSRYHSFA